MYNTTVTLKVKLSFASNTLGTFNERRAAEIVRAALYKTYANPEREDEGLRAVISVEPA